jgi:hypothetical protein
MYYCVSSWDLGIYSFHGMSPYKQYSNKDKKDTACDELVSILKEVKKDAAR